MVNRKTASALTIAALLACAIPAKSVASLVAPVIAQSAPSFPVPDKAEENVSVSSSSDNMNSISEALASGFEGKYDGEVEIETKSASEAIADVANGNADVAAISRPLTAEEKAQGLVQVPVRREKIAIIVGEDNAFNGSITSGQFAQIFKGEITDWSEVGGEAGPIRFVDRPDASETRQALQPYPVFVSQPLATGSNATQVSEDSTDAIAEELGADGISYALVGEVDAQSNVRAIELHKTLPDDPRYPFSQPYSFVYADAASPAAAAFLGYATGGEGQSVIDQAGVSGYGVAPVAAADADATTEAGETGADATTGADGTNAAVADGSIGELNDAGELVDADGNLISPEGFLIDADGNLIDADGNLLPEGAAGIVGSGINLDGLRNGVGNAVDGAGNAVGEAAGGVGNAVGDAAGGVGDLAGRGRWWWLLLPLAGLGLLIWAAGRRGSEEEAGYSATANGTTDDRVRNSFVGKMPNVNTPNADMPNVGTKLGSAKLGSIEADGIKTSVGNVGNKMSGMGKAGVVGAAGLAGGAAAGAAGLAGKMKGGVQGGIDGARTNLQGGIKGGIDGVKGGVDGLRGNVQGGIDGVKGGVDGLRGNVQGGVDGLKGGAQSRMDGLRGNVQGGVDGLKGNVQGRVGDVRDAANNVKDGAAGQGGSWLDRAKQRINEAADNVKDTASDIKDDIKKD